MKFQDKYLLDRLNSLSQSNIYPYHMPGHKRSMKGYPLEELYQVDITEIDDFDNLHEPEGILAALQERIKSIYHTQETFCLINGSSCGILSAISATTIRGGSIMLARNSHKSAYHAIFQEELTAVYLYPEYMEEYGLYGAIKPQTVAEALSSHPDCKTVFITSPTYEGIVSDIQSIAELVHAHGGILIVDEAHGAHLRFTGQEEKSAVVQGADIVIQSIHKTLPAPTQTALLHLCSERADRQQIKRYLRIYQSSSPSYVLLAGIEQCFRILAEEEEQRRDFFRSSIKRLRQAAEQCRHIKVIPDTDQGKLVISVKNTSWTGQRLFEALLTQYELQMEMAADTYVVAIMTLMDTQEGYERLAEALKALDECIGSNETMAKHPTVARNDALIVSKKKAAMSIYEAATAPREAAALCDCQGRIAAEFINLYPPGIPVIAPGEHYTKEVVEIILRSRKQGLTVHGMDEEEKVSVVLR